MRRRLLRIWGRLPIPRGVRRWMVLAASVRKFPVGVTAVIVDDQGRLLMFRHTYRGKYPWGLPSGWLEPGEQPDAAIAREIGEETGLKVVDPKLLLVLSAPDAHHLDVIYRATLAGGDFSPSAEVTAMRWFGPDELPEMMPSQYDMIRAIFRVLRAGNE